MTGDAPERAAGGGDSTQSVPARKARDAGLILPLVGLAALMPPLGPIFAIEGTVLGVPLIVAYVFAVWGGLILAAAALGPRLAGAAPAPYEPPSTEG